MGLNRPQENEIEDFFAALPSWLRKHLQGGYALTPEERSEMLDSDWIEMFGKAQDCYLELLKRYPAKLKEYRKQKARSAAREVLRRLPPLPVGARRGMRRGTVDEAEHLLNLIADFVKTHGTKRGAWDYATKKVYGSESNQHARIERGRQAVRRYKKHVAKAVQKPSS